MTDPIDAERAELIWRAAGETPTLSDFESGSDAASFYGAEMIRRAIRAQQDAGVTDQPWVRVGETIYNPEQVHDLYDSDVEQRTGEEQAMPGDEPWE